MKKGSDNLKGSEIMLLYILCLPVSGQMDKSLLSKRICRWSRGTIKNEEMNKYANKPFVIEIRKTKQFNLKNQLSLAAIETIVQL